MRSTSSDVDTCEHLERPAPALPRSRPGAQGYDGTLLSRYECKYVVDEELLPHLRRALRAFTVPDKYAAPDPQHRYAIGSLYLDSPDLRLYQMNADGVSNRYKLRVRSYVDDPGAPVFFEIKRRIDGVIKKRRARVERAAALEYLRACARGSHGPARPDIAEFTRLVGETAAAPVVRVRYWREAYESVGGDPVRVTFDTCVEHAVTTGADLSVWSGDWETTRVPGAILEIKFTDVFPSWIQEIVDRFELRRRSLAKYALSIEEHLDAPLSDPIRMRASGFAH